MEQEIKQIMGKLEYYNNPECLLNAFKRTILNQLRSFVLTQVEFSPQELENEHDRYFEENLEILDEFGSCGLEVIDSVPEYEYQNLPYPNFLQIVIPGMKLIPEMKEKLNNVIGAVEIQS